MTILGVALATLSLTPLPADAEPRSADSTTLGVIWTPPSSPNAARQELRRIARSGAAAVRLTEPPSAATATQADTLGLRLYVDLPVAYVSSPPLSAPLQNASPTLDRLQALAQQHRSLTHVGLAHTADTTLPQTCTTLQQWTERVHDANASLRTYYVTPFVASADACADAVDEVLLDFRGLSSPVARWERWRSRTDSVGIGALGTWVQPTAASGLQVPHSPEQQARYLERLLPRLLDSTQTPPSTLFVSRWEDRASAPLRSRRYGLHDAHGTARPAARVVRGLFSGTQRVFAFPAGAAPSDKNYGLLFLGWGLIALLGGLYAQNLFVRRTVVRYFTAPGFYRDALRDGHDLHPGTNGLLLALVSGALAITSICAARLAAAAPATEHVLAAFPSSIQALLAAGIEHPSLAGAAVGLAIAGLLLGWMVALVLAARWWTQVSFVQGLVLVVWPCWPALLVFPMALAAGADAPLSPSLFGFFLLGGGGLTCLYVTGRVLYDYKAVAGLPAWILAPLSLLSPLALAVGGAIVLTQQYDVSLAFLWHLATHT